MNCNFCPAPEILAWISVRGMREIIVRAFYERGINITQVAAELNVAKSTAYDQKRIVWAWLAKIDAAAQREIAEKLEQMLDGNVPVA